MTQATDADIREIKTAVDSIAKATEANTKAISDLTLEIRLGFTRLDGKIDNIDGRLLAVENRIGGLDTRLWTFGGIILGAVLAALLTIFGRYIFTGNPIA
jgi:hypothetical protein